jgi:REP element-mobilizing transposase RayT
MKPNYTNETVTNPAYQLRYTWTGWPSDGIFPAEFSGEHFDSLRREWEKDGIRHLEHNWLANHIQFTCSVKPHVAPTLFAARIKGRLQYELRKAGLATRFQRKVGVGCIGDNCADEVVAYIRNQIPAAQFIDPHYMEQLKQFTVEFPEVDLSQPTPTARGRYWYNLHLVLVARDRTIPLSWQQFAVVRDRTCQVARAKGHRLAIVSVMPEHLHAAMRGNIEQSPQTIALTFLNELDTALGGTCHWRFGYYVGTSGGYNMDAVRARPS